MDPRQLEFDTCGTQVIDLPGPRADSADCKTGCESSAGVGIGSCRTMNRHLCAGVMAVNPCRPTLVGQPLPDLAFSGAHSLLMGALPVFVWRVHRRIHAAQQVPMGPAGDIDIGDAHRPQPTPHAQPGRRVAQAVQVHPERERRFEPDAG